MHVRATTLQIQPGKMQEAIDLARDSILPVAKDLKGYQGLYFMTDTDSGKALAITVWETAADMMAIETSGPYRHILAMLVGLLSGAPASEHYELSIEDSA